MSLIVAVCSHKYCFPPHFPHLSNVGISSKHAVKLLDFGLVRPLPNKPVNELKGVYKMSSKVGTYRFMAPEVSQGRPYNEKADVYSFAYILWDILSLEKPFQFYSKEVHRRRVIEGGERPAIDYSWPAQIQQLLKKSWSFTISERPSMTEVNAVLKEVIAELSGPKVETTTVAAQNSTNVVCGDVNDLLKGAISEITELTGATANTATTTYSINSRRNLELVATKRDSLKSKKRSPLKASRFWL